MIVRSDGSEAVTTMIFGIDQRWVFALMVLVILVPFTVFLYDGYTRLDRLLTSLENSRSLEAAALLKAPGFAAMKREQMDALSRLALEHDTMVLRAQRLSASLQMRTWLRFMSLAFGAVLVVIGAVFVLGRVSQDAAGSSMDMKAATLAFTLKTTYPGLILACLGSLLIIVPNTARQAIDGYDASSFFSIMPPPQPHEGITAKESDENHAAALKKALGAK